MSDMIHLVKKYCEELNPIERRIQSFNDFMKYKVQKIIDEVKVVTSNTAPPGTYVEFGKVRFEKPISYEKDGSKKELYPMEARLRKKTYAATIYVEMKLYVDNVLREHKDIKIGEIPIMLKSDYCYLKKQENETQEEYEERLLKMGEDPKEPGGYFIINGNEKAMVCFDELAPNKLIIQKSKRGSKNVVEGKVFSVGEEIVRDGNKIRTQNIFVRYRDGTLVYECNVLNKPVNIVPVLMALGLTKQDIIENLNSYEAKLDMYINFEICSDINTQEDALLEIGKKSTTSTKDEVRINWASRIIDEYFLPHIGETKEARIKKAHYILKAIEKMCLIARDKIKEDDKDHYTNKRIKEPGILMEEVFRAAIQSLVVSMKQHMDRTIARGRKLTLYSIVKQDALTEKILNHMATGMWPTGYTGVLANMDRYSYYSYIKAVTKVKSPLSATASTIEARDLHPTYFGKICPVHFIEGPNAGLSKFISFGAYCSKVIDENIKEKIKDLDIEFL